LKKIKVTASDKALAGFGSAGLCVFIFSIPVRASLLLSNADYQGERKKINQIILSPQSSASGCNIIVAQLQEQLMSDPTFEGSLLGPGVYSIKHFTAVIFVI
jgi:hypothetical protein